MSVHIAIIPSRQGNKTYYSKLVRRSYRDAKGRVQKKTLANLSSLSDDAIELLRGHLKGKRYLEAEAAFEVLRSRSHGAVEAVSIAFRRLGLPAMLAARPSRERNLACAMIAARIIRPHTRLATTRWWQDTTLETEFDIRWRACRRTPRGAGLASGPPGPDPDAAGSPALRRRRPGAVRYQLELLRGLALPAGAPRLQPGREKGKLQINFGLLCDVRGRPAAVSVMEGNIADTETLLPEIERLRTTFGLQRLAIVGDRGMIARTRIDELRQLGGIDWITALKSVSIQKLIRKGTLQPRRFDDADLFEILHPDYPGERLVACRNERLAALRAHTRESLRKATEADLKAPAVRVKEGTLAGEAAIALRIGEQINRYKMKKHFEWEIAANRLHFRRKRDSIAQEAALDGIHVIRTSLPEAEMTAADCVRNYKALTRVERAFRSLKTVSLRVRPIHHRTADRVRAHFFLCMLAYYVEWHMRDAWSELLFADPAREKTARTRDPVAPAERGVDVERTAATACLEDGSAVYCFRTLIGHLQSINRNTCRPKSSRRRPSATPPETFELTTNPTEKQQKALDRLKAISTG